MFLHLQGQAQILRFSLNSVAAQVWDRQLTYTYNNGYTCELKSEIGNALTIVRIIESDANIALVL